MSFSLYIYGSFNGFLQVVIEENGTNAALLVWERQGQQMDDWEAVALELRGFNHGCVTLKNRNLKHIWKNVFGVQSKPWCQLDTQ